jgi:hypothetical protein
MTVQLAPFFHRVLHSLGPLTAMSDEALTDHLASLGVHVHLATDPGWRDAGELLLTLLARLFPNLSADTDNDSVDLSHLLTLHPDLQPADASRQRVISVALGPAGDVHAESGISVTASGWNVLVDKPPASPQPAHPLAALAAACLAAAEVFRDAFAEQLPSPRSGNRQGGFNLITCGPETDQVPPPTAELDVGTVHLAGAGAVGQACVLALRAARVCGHLIVVDPEALELSNLQRYVLSTLSDVGRTKVDIIEERLAGTSLRVSKIEGRWGRTPETAPMRECVLVALDTAADRLSVAAGLHHTILNAWTQPADLGWSRHHNPPHGEPCLACLYLPKHERPSEDEQIAAALKQHRLRTLGYLTTSIPIGQPLPFLTQVAEIAAPDDAEVWLQRSLLDDLIVEGIVDVADRPRWAMLPLSRLYQDGVCGDALLRRNLGTVQAEYTVPLAAQSAMAGVMLATSLIATRDPNLSPHLPKQVEARLDVLAGLPQELRRPRKPTAGCLCQDSLTQQFLARHELPGAEPQSP